MEAAAIDHFGPAEVLTLHVLPVPACGADEVLIALDTAGVGPWDVDIRDGWFPSGKPQFPLVLGIDGAGIIAAVGSRVRRLKVGDKVYSYSWANPKGGFYAEYVAVAAEKVAHIPRRLDLQHAGAIPTTGLMALQGIDDALEVKKRENVVIHGGSGVSARWPSNSPSCAGRGFLQPVPGWRAPSWCARWAPTWRSMESMRTSRKQRDASHPTALTPS
jgi:NADPH:quinone reductase-like Zn-dependent oxidoreductase